MNRKTLLFLSLSILILNSCAQIFNGIVLKNQCKQCDLIDTFTTEIVYSIDGCGAQNTDLRGKCESQAWVISRGKHICDFEIKCKTWKKDK